MFEKPSVVLKNILHLYKYKMWYCVCENNLHILKTNTPCIPLNKFYKMVPNNLCSSVYFRCSYDCSSGLLAVTRCTNEERPTVEGTNYCGLLKDESNMNPFLPCVQDPAINQENFFEDCVYDTCAYKDNWDNMKSRACDVLLEFAELCEISNHYIYGWKSRSGCCKYIGLHGTSLYFILAVLFHLAVWTLMFLFFQKIN